MSEMFARKRILVRLERIRPNPWQTRMEQPPEEIIKELALDIAEHGLLQAPVGRLHNGDWAAPAEQFDAGVWEMKLHEGNNLVVELAFGHSRLAAFRWLHELKDNSNIPGDWSKMPVEIRTLSDEEMASLAWSENEKRVGVTAIERAKAIEKWMGDFGWSQAQAAEKLGLARATVSNILRLQRLPDEVQKALAEGMSERVAMALIPLFDLPEEVRKKYHPYGYEGKAIVNRAIGGESSDWIRGRVEEFIKYHTMDLNQAEFKLTELVPENIPNVYCGLCSTCDSRLANRNLCLKPDCYSAKVEYAHRQYLATASAATGIAVIDPSYVKGGNPTELPWEDLKLQKILGMKCENLRLTWREVYKFNQRDAATDVRVVKGFPHALIVCDKRNGSCTCQKGMEIAGSQVMAAEGQLQGRPGDQVIGEGEPAKVTPRELEEIAREGRKAKKDALAHIEEARGKVKKLLRDALERDDPGAFYLLANHYTHPRHDQLNLDESYNSLASDMLRLVVPEAADSVDELYDRINQRLEALELEQVYPGQTLVEMVAEEEG